MFSLRDVIIFFAGFEFFNTIGHIFLALHDPFPVRVMNFVITYEFNLFQVFLNLVITLMFFLCIHYMSKSDNKINHRPKYDRRARPR